MTSWNWAAESPLPPALPTHRFTHGRRSPNSKGAASPQSDCSCKIIGYKLKWSRFFILLALFVLPFFLTFHTIYCSLDILNRCRAKTANLISSQAKCKIKIPSSYLKTKIVYLHLERCLQDKMTAYEQLEKKLLRLSINKNWSLAVRSLHRSYRVPGLCY